MRSIGSTPFGKDDQPAPEQQYLEMATLHPDAAFDDPVDVIIAIAKIAADENLAPAQTDQKRQRRRFETEAGSERALQMGHGIPHEKD